MKVKLFFSSLLIIFLLISLKSFSQIISNINAGYNIKDETVDLFFDLESDEFKGYKIDLKLFDIENKKIIKIPEKLLNLNLTNIYPNQNIFLKIDVSNLNFNGEFIPILAINQDYFENVKTSNTINPKFQNEIMKEKKIEHLNLPLEKNLEMTKLEIKKNNEVKKEQIDPQSLDIITSLNLKSNSFNELSNLIRSKTSIFMGDGKLYPININLNLIELSFKCDFVNFNSDFIKIGLYYGPSSIGCESCESVIRKNPNSILFENGNYNNLSYSLILINSK